MPDPVSFEEFTRSEILDAKARWLGVICAVILPNAVQDLRVTGNLAKCEEILKARGAIIREFPNHSEVWVKKKNGERFKLGSFEPILTVEKKMAFLARIAGWAVDVETPERVNLS